MEMTPKKYNLTYIKGQNDFKGNQTQKNNI